MKKLLSLLMVLALLLGGVGALAEDDGIVVNEAGAVENPEDIVAGENELIFWSLFSGGEGAVRDIIEQVLRARGDWARDSMGVTPSTLVASR